MLDIMEFIKKFFQKNAYKKFLSFIHFMSLKIIKTTQKCLKSDSYLPKKFLFIRFTESSLKMMKNAFYFILKTLFVLTIFKFLSWHFGHVPETA